MEVSSFFHHRPLSELPARVFGSLIGRVFIGFFLLLLLGILAGNLYADRTLEREYAKIRARGEPLTLLEAAPPAVPDAENAAFVYEKAFQILKANRAHRMVRTQGQDREPLLIERFFSPDSKDQMTVTLEQMNGIMVEQAATLLLAEQASRMPRCRFPIRWQDGAGVLFTHLGKLRELLRLVVAGAVYHAQSGEAGPAVNDLITALKISDSVMSEPSSLSQLVRYAMIALTLNGMQRVMSICPLNESDLKRLSDAISQVQITEPFVKTMEGERCFGLWAFNAYRQDPVAFINEMKNDSVSPDEGLARWIVRGVLPLAAPILKMDQVSYLRQMSRVIEFARSSQTSYDRLQLPPLPSYALVASHIVPAFNGIFDKRSELNARLEVAKGALALQAYRLRTGHYPGRLEEMVSVTGFPFPKDPFTGKPLRYRREGMGFILYSVGINGRDDDGQGKSQKNGNRPTKARPDDLAWKLTGSLLKTAASS